MLKLIFNVYSDAVMDDNPIIIVKLNKDIYFTKMQIDDLFNLRLLNMEPQDSVS